MKKETVRWIGVLAVLMVLYLLISFLIPFVHTAVFWVSFVFTLLAFGVVAASVYIAFIKNLDAKSKFYGFPIAKIGMIYGTVQLISSVLFMALSPWAPIWLAVLLYALFMGAAVIGMISADAVAEEIQVQDVKIKQNTSYMREMQSKMMQMTALCENSKAVGPVKKLAEALRYSDPVSNEALTNIEEALPSEIDQLKCAVDAEDVDAVQGHCRKAMVILEERNRLCKLNKK